jgi:hypothetical protein
MAYLCYDIVCYGIIYLNLLFFVASVLLNLKHNCYSHLIT